MDPPQSVRTSPVRATIVGVLAGQLDAGFSSLATFAAGIYAVRSLRPAELGLYALLFSAFLVVSQVPTRLVFSPTQTISIAVDPSRRLGYAGDSIRRGALVALVAAGGVWLGALPAFGEVSPSIAMPLVVTASALALVSPVQDHLRQLFHLARRSWVSATISGIHFGVTIVALRSLGTVGPAWAPYGALLIGNLTSVVVGLRWIHRRRHDKVDTPSVRELLAIGRWLLVVGVADTGFYYLAMAVLKTLAGVETLGFVEGARVVSQPLMVVALGLNAVLGPRLLEASSHRDLGSARRWRRSFAGLFTIVALPFSILVLATPTHDLLRGYLPTAYTVDGLLAASLAATAFLCLLRPRQAELLGGRLQAGLAMVMIVAGIVEVVAITSAFRLGAFAAPLSLALGAMATLLVSERLLRNWYQGGSPRRKVAR